MYTFRRIFASGGMGLLCAALTVAALVPSAFGQAVIKVNDDVNVKFGILGQFQGNWLEDATRNGYSQDLGVRRLRLLVGGQVAKNVTFFVETDSPNIGMTVAGKKNNQPSMYLQDAFVNFKFSQAFSIDGGLILIPSSRNGLQSAASLLPVDYGPYSFSQSGPTTSNVGRDTGFQARGYLNKNHLEYRLGVFQGIRDVRSHNSFRTTGRIQYNVFDTEVGPFYTGTYLGKKKILAFGGSYDTQRGYSSADVDMFLDMPLGANALTAQVDVIRFDGDTFIATLPEQTDTLLELGYFVKSLKLTPFVQAARREIKTGNTGDETRYGAGLAYWLAGYNANLKFQYNRIKPRVGGDANQLLLQMQMFYF